MLPTLSLHLFAYLKDVDTEKLADKFKFAEGTMESTKVN